MSNYAPSTPERRAALTEAIRAETGIDETLIANVVDEFYTRVRADELIGPIFNTRIADWSPHLAQMRAFWGSVALMTGEYHGQPMRKHLPLPVDAEHFDRWLKLFEETVNDLCNPKAAEHFMERARRIAESLELGIAGANGVMLGRGERFRQFAS
ncbi:group III truncated hemoglobin [Afipia carboxidovorans]|uniref:group III truncated hemoglobin n=1 Tax=Afipia carboxidovorans TaxID=40137 RepID=UPI00308D3800|nr:group III truncated hemoglobin [Afipia carboxidovorans]